MDYTCQETIIQNMKDCGCDKQTIDEFVKCFKSRDKLKQKRILNDCRKKMLDELHKKQKEIDLLDYLVYQLEKCECDCANKK